MIDTSKLKYYETLREKGVIDEQQNDLDSIMNTLEEKQFEFLKRLETTKDEDRKDEINELLNTIELQLKELAAIKTALGSGIIVDSNRETISETKNGIDRKSNLVFKKDERERKNGKTLLLISIIAIAIIAAATAVIINNDVKTDQNTATNDSTAVDTSSTDDNDDSVKLGVQWTQDIGEEFFSGIYVTNVRNQTLIDGGLQPGDRIITINGENARTSDEAHAAIIKHNPGEGASVVVDRDGEQKTITGLYIKASEQLPYRDSGEVTFTLDGRKIKITFLENEKVEIEY